ncbi:MAG: hypothetical protein Q8P08_01775 [bacterium]|nr:hypothetical protein [bacterium]
MAKITDRQRKILDSIVEEYIETAEPISSSLIEEDYDFDLSPATIRNEMQKLTDLGFLSQPHTSAGRVPTDKGYRLYVDELLEKELPGTSDLIFDDLIENELEDAFKLLSLATRSLAESSSTLALSHLLGENTFWKEGWESVIQEPEFREEKFVVSFRDFLQNFEKEIEDFEIGSGINVYIGRENPFPGARDFSLIISKCSLPHKEEGFLALLGPKRMSYQRNINSMNSLLKILDRF